FVYSVCTALLPADSGPQRKIQYFAGGDGGLGAHFWPARRAGDDCFAGEGAFAARATRRNRIPQCVVCVSWRSESEGRGLGTPRCFLPRGAGTDAGDCWTHGRG